MTQTEYQQKSNELWYEYTAMLRRNCASRYVFDKIFDRAYALGKEKETITQDEIENEAVDYAFGKNKKRPDARPDTAPEYACEDLIDAFKAGANYALGKQEKEADPSTCTEECSSRCKSPDYDNIINRGFREHNRLQIATQVMCAMLSNTADNNLEGESMETCVKWAYEIADELIKQSEL